MILMPIVYVTDMDRAVRFYSALGFAPDPNVHSRMWTQLRAGNGAILALHHETKPAPSSPLRVELALVATVPLHSLKPRLEGQGIACGPIVDEAFGFSMLVHDPDGLPVQNNQHEH